jgi:hypothetical protein
VSGPVDRCIERLQAMVDVGLTKLLLFSGAFRVSDLETRQKSDLLLATEVLSALKK